MKIATFFLRSIRRAFALTGIFVLVMFIISAITADKTQAIILSQYLLIMLFAFIAGFSHELLFVRNLPLAARIGIQYPTLLVPFLLIFTLSGKIAAEAGSIILFGLLFSLIYCLVLTTELLIMHFTGYYTEHMSNLKDKKKNEATYTNRFK